MYTIRNYSLPLAYLNSCLNPYIYSRIDRKIIVGMKWIFGGLSRKIQDFTSFMRNASKNVSKQTKIQLETEEEKRGNAKIETDERNEGLADIHEEVHRAIVIDDVVTIPNQRAVVDVHGMRVNSFDHRSVELIIESGYEEQRVDFTDDTLHFSKNPTDKVYRRATRHHDIVQPIEGGSSSYTNKKYPSQMITLTNYNFQSANDIVKLPQPLCKVIDTIAESVDFKDTNLRLK